MSNKINTPFIGRTIDIPTTLNSYVQGSFRSIFTASTPVAGTDVRTNMLDGYMTIATVAPSKQKLWWLDANLTTWHLFDLLINSLEAPNIITSNLDANGTLNIGGAVSTTDGQIGKTTGGHFTWSATQATLASPNTTRYITADSGQILINSNTMLFAAAGLSDSNSINVLIQPNGVIYPQTTNNTRLGLSTNRWSEIYGVELHISNIGNNQIAFNNGTSIVGSSNFTYDGTSLVILNASGARALGLNDGAFINFDGSDPYWHMGRNVSTTSGLYNYTRTLVTTNSLDILLPGDGEGFTIGAGNGPKANLSVFEVRDDGAVYVADTLTVSNKVLTPILDAIAPAGSLSIGTVNASSTTIGFVSNLGSSINLYTGNGNPSSSAGNISITLGTGGDASGSAGGVGGTLAIYGANGGGGDATFVGGNGGGIFASLGQGGFDGGAGPGNGAAMAVSAGNGGDSGSSATGGTGGSIAYAAGAGGFGGGIGGAFSIYSGGGGNQDGTHPGGNAGLLTIHANTGGDGSASLASGKGGNIVSTAGNAGVDNGGPGNNGGDYTIDAGFATGSGTNGIISIGTTNAASGQIGVTGTTGIVNWDNTGMVFTGQDSFTSLTLQNGILAMTVPKTGGSGYFSAVLDAYGFSVTDPLPLESPHTVLITGNSIDRVIGPPAVTPDLGEFLIGAGNAVSIIIGGSATTGGVTVDNDLTVTGNFFVDGYMESTLFDGNGPYTHTIDLGEAGGTNWLHIKPGDNGDGYGSYVDFFGTYNSTLNPTYNDNVFHLGHNVNAGGGAVIPGRGVLSDAWESYFNGGHVQQERHLKWVDVDGYETRFISFEGHLDDGSTNLFIDSTNIRLGSGRNANTNPSVSVAPTITVISSPDGYNVALFDQDASGYVRISAGSPGAGSDRASLQVSSNGQATITTHSVGVLQDANAVQPQYYWDTNNTILQSPDAVSAKIVMAGGSGPILYANSIAALLVQFNQIFVNNRLLYVQRDGVANSTRGDLWGSFLARNNTAATNIVTQQFSPPIVQTGYGWTGSANRAVSFETQSQPDGLGNGKLAWLYSSDEANYSEIASLTNTGKLTVSGDISIDGYTISATSTSVDQALVYDGSAYVPKNISTQKSTASDFALVDTNPHSVVTYTPAAPGNLMVSIYYRVITASTTLTVTISWTDGSGAQTITPVSGSQVVGSYTMQPVYINSTASAITVTATAGTANQIFVSSTITGV